MKKASALMAFLMIAAAPMAAADETGFAGIHAWKKEKSRRICMSEHFHDGSGLGKTRKEAEKAAKRSWIEFTAFEYGTSWGSYKLAASKVMDCAETANRWSCMTRARPCKRHVKKAKGYSRSASR